MSLPTQLGVPLVIINWDMAVPLQADRADRRGTDPRPDR
jgi:hypothetical protein